MGFVPEIQMCFSPFSIFYFSLFIKFQKAIPRSIIGLFQNVQQFWKPLFTQKQQILIPKINFPKISQQPPYARVGHIYQNIWCCLLVCPFIHSYICLFLTVYFHFHTHNTRTSINNVQQPLCFVFVNQQHCLIKTHLFERTINTCFRQNYGQPIKKLTNNK